MDATEEKPWPWVRDRDLVKLQHLLRFLLAEEILCKKETRLVSPKISPRSLARSGSVNFSSGLPHLLPRDTCPLCPHTTNANGRHA